MAHRFEIKDGGRDALILAFPPEVIRSLARRLDGIERMQGSLPEMMQAPVQGVYTKTSHCTDVEKPAAKSQTSTHKIRGRKKARKKCPPVKVAREFARKPKRKK